MTFQGRDARFTTFGSSVATFTTGISGNIYTSPDMMDDDTFIWNAAIVDYATDAGTPAQYQDNTDIGNQGVRVYQDSNLGSSASTAIIQNGPDAQDLAYIMVERYKDSKLRAVALNLDCDSSPADLFPKALGYDISTRITLNLDNADNPGAIPMKSYHIEAITHTWHAWQNCWHTQWQLWDVNQYKIVHSIMTTISSVVNSGMDYTTVHNAADAAYIYNCPPLASLNLVGQATALGPSVTRGLLVLDTSAIPASPAVLSASLFLYIANSNDGLTLCLVLHAAVNYPVVISNYGDLLGQTAILGSVVVPAGLTNTWIEIPLTALGVTAINAGSTTTFALRSLDDINSVAPTGDQTASIVYSADYAYLAVQFNL